MNAPTGWFSRLLRYGPAVTMAMVAGGFLWVIHGYLRFMMPRGPEVAWREDLGYSLILSTELFLLYNLPGVLALLLTAWAALSYFPALRTSRAGLERSAGIFALVASVCGLAAAAGQLALFDPLTTGGLSLGLPFLGLALFLAGMAVLTDGKGTYGHPGLPGPVLMLLGVMAMFTLPLRLLLYALEVLPLAFGTVVLVLFGAGWVLLGLSLHNSLRDGAPKNPGTARA